jgi:hypothetical protein
MQTVQLDIWFEASTAAVMKSFVFWDIKPCSPIKLNRRFGETTNLAACSMFLLGLFFDAEDGTDVYLRNVVWLSTGQTALYPRKYNSSCPPFCNSQILQSIDWWIGKDLGGRYEDRFWYHSLAVVLLNKGHVTVSVSPVQCWFLAVIPFNSHITYENSECGLSEWARMSRIIGVTKAWSKIASNTPNFGVTET